jgi:hypothetical protein
MDEREIARMIILSTSLGIKLIRDAANHSNYLSWAILK